MAIVEEFPERLRRRFRVRNPLLVNLLSEFFATTLLLFAGTGIVVQHVLSEGKLNTWTHVHLGWGFLVALCVYGTFKTSGGHLNPAVSLAMFTLGKLSLVHFFYYSIVQTIAAFLGSGLTFWAYADQIQNFTGGIRAIAGDKATAGMFCSFPKEHISNSTAFLDQVIGTALLCMFIAAIIDKRNKIPTGLQPLFFGLGLFVVGSSYGMMLGNPINPARDFGPRLFAFVFGGYGWEVFSWHNYYFWIPIVAPLFGGPLGVWLYQLFVGIHIPDDTPSNIGLMDLPTLEVNGIKSSCSELEPLSENGA
ncbi:major intrinsic protein [Ditylenchus destructor]|nr:major intrinsic protein [Ditylenchus destructor]